MQEYSDFKVNLIAIEKNGLFYGTTGHCYGALAQISEFVKPEALLQFNQSKFYTFKVKSNTYVYDNSGKGKLFVVGTTDSLVMVGNRIKKNDTYWYRVLLDGKDGLIKDSYVKKNSNGIPFIKLLPSNTIFGYVVNSAYVYEEKSFKGKKLAVTRKGTCIAINKLDNEYYYIILQKGAGHIDKSAVSKNYRIE